MHMHEIATKMFAMYMYATKFLPFWDMQFVLCVGANADLASKYGGTPLKVAQKELAGASNPEAKKHYKKVHEGTHTHVPSHTLKLPMVANRNFAYFQPLLVKHEFF